MTVLSQPAVTAGRPPMVRVHADPGELAGWLAAHRGGIDAAVRRHGALLLRGLPVTDQAAARLAVAGLVDRPMVEREPFAPRERLGALTKATSWPEDEPMCMHHELSYARQVPSRQVFCCLAAPTVGGATALADAAAVLGDLPDPLVARFERHGWQLARSYHALFGLTWQEAFGTDSPDEVEAYCRAEGIQWAWDGAEGLRTRRRRPAVVRHPATGQRLWFNQVAFLNEWTMDPTVREYLLLEFGRAGLPFSTRCGDGGELDRETVDLINAVYAAHTVREPWQVGDLLVIDNLRTAHSRDAYQGPREVIVALGDPVSLPELPAHSGPPIPARPRDPLSRRSASGRGRRRR
ncbi:MAG: TauD/TfdA family dioxygenase [Actinobacteria bacterium]|nr:TauD/TfdA family dioxygenase [Actinomycetota bacterium]